MIKAFALFLALAPQIVLAQGWEVLGNAAMLESAESSESLVVTKEDSKGLLAAIASPDVNECQMEKLSSVIQLGAFTINGRRVKMVGRCSSGNYYAFPQTKEGQAYVLGEITRNADITIQYGTGNTDTFINEDGSRALLEIMESDKGI